MAEGNRTREALRFFTGLLLGIGVCLAWSAHVKIRHEEKLRGAEMRIFALETTIEHLKKDYFKSHSPTSSPAEKKSNDPKPSNLNETKKIEEG